MASELDLIQAALDQAEGRVHTSTVAALAANHNLKLAETAREQALSRVADLETEQQNGARASNGAAALLRAALTDSQRKLGRAQKQYEMASNELAALRAATSGAIVHAPGTTLSAPTAMVSEVAGSAIQAVSTNATAMQTESLLPDEDRDEEQSSAGVDVDQGDQGDQGDSESAASAAAKPAALNGGVRDSAAASRRVAACSTPNTWSAQHVRFCGVTPNYGVTPNTGMTQIPLCATPSSSSACAALPGSVSQQRLAGDEVRRAATTPAPPPLNPRPPPYDQP